VPIGVAVDHARVLVARPDGAVVTEPGIVGEILVSGPSVSPGYLGEPGPTSRTRVQVDTGGERLSCYRTGDFGHRDEAGRLVFHGRRDGLVKTRGYRVELGDVEAALTRHPALGDAAVIPTAHAEYSQVLRAAVVPRPGGAVTAAEVLHWCRTELPTYMVPVTVTVLDALPLTGTGKTDRLALRRRIEAAGTEMAR
jgi:acyl-CoA synthetase (AMP-forming)/AMP-acid ligase II